MRRINNMKAIAIVVDTIACAFNVYLYVTVGHLISLIVAIILLFLIILLATIGW